MTRYFTILFSALAALLMAGPAAAQVQIIQVGNLLTDAMSDPSGPATIIVRDGKIAEIRRGPASAINEPDAQFIDLSDKTVLPGLIDLHTHLSGDPGGDYWRAAIDPPEWYTLIAAKNARITARAGFTTVRDLGSRTDQVTQSLRRATADGVVAGPRIVTSARTIAIVGGHGDTSGFREDVNHVLGSGYTCTGPVECSQKVRKASKNGADLIKITATGGVLSQQGRGLEAHFTDEEMKAIVDTAHVLGLRVAAHAHGARGIEAAARAGVDTIEHGTYLDKQAADVMKANGTVLIPTLMAFKGISERLGQGVYTPVVEEKIRAVADTAKVFMGRAYRWGVPIAFGTDAGVFTHGRNAGEFALMVGQGLSNREAIASATTGAAKVLNMENQIGRIAVGYSADLIAVDGNPLDDVQILEKVDWVMVRGRVID
ncbi:amidohydrolase family protein [Parasphingorhabdus sp.]|uniref:metal-dependent hydrolase family protein n=1 Tax=Parasphingorhabdus sp. TaxID=2709688 RepID=UPI003D2772A9